jgi:NAD+ kinase
MRKASLFICTSNRTLVKIALYGKRFDDEFTDSIEKLLDAMVRRGIGIVVYEKFYLFLTHKVTLPSTIEIFRTTEDLQGVSYLLSVGGDGTLLETASIIRDTRIPVLGINTGRLGFLSPVSGADADQAIEALVNQSFTLDRRSLIEIKSAQQDFGDFPFALNDVTITNKQRSSMITIHAYVNDQFMSTYWADGLIVATPTGSTAYSLSCGGPIVMPDSNNVILTPIAPHNLNVRPFVLPNTSKVSLRAEGREPHFALTLDSRTFVIDNETIVDLTRASFEFHLISLPGFGFFNTIRQKMGWGLDARSKRT